MSVPPLLELSYSFVVVPKNHRWVPSTFFGEKTPKDCVLLTVAALVAAKTGPEVKPLGVGIIPPWAVIAPGVSGGKSGENPISFTGP